MEGSEEYFDESEHVDGFAAEERSSDGEEVDESEGEDGRGPEGSDFAAEEGYEEGGPDAEEGYEEVWDEVQEGKRKQQRYPDGTLLQQRYSADQRYSVGKGSVLKKKKNYSQRDE